MATNCERDARRRPQCLETFATVLNIPALSHIASFRGILNMLNTFAPSISPEKGTASSRVSRTRIEPFSIWFPLVRTEQGIHVFSLKCVSPTRS